MEAEPYRGAHADLALHVPFVCGRVLLAGAGLGRLAQRLRQENALEVHAVERDEAAARRARMVCHSAQIAPLEMQSPSFPPDHFGALIFRDFEGKGPDFARVLMHMQPVLRHAAHILVLTANPSYWRHLLPGAAPPPALTPQDVVRAAAQSGLKLLGFWLAEDTAFSHAAQSGGEVVHVGGTALQLAPELDRDTLACRDILFLLVSRDYFPVAHARALREGGQPEAAYEILDRLPPQCAKDPNMAADIELGKLLSLSDWTAQNHAELPLPYFSRIFHHFRKTVALRPGETAAYETMAGAWRRLGDETMAAGLLRTIAHAQGKTLPPAHPRITIPETAPQWETRQSAPRVLFVIPPRPHYGLDALYDGLCRVLGPENVTDFPSKPTLHGGLWPGLEDYPCMFRWPQHAHGAEDIAAGLRANQFDLVLYGDLDGEVPQNDVLMIMAALGNTPLFLFDANDEPNDLCETKRALLGNPPLAGYFKREMMTGVQYSPLAMPMPFSFSEGLAEKVFPEIRPNDFFWAGHRNAYTRRLTLETLEKTLHMDLSPRYSPEAYAQALRTSRIGLNLFGFGFDTVRYWELPAHGCLLLSERPPIRIPDDFEDGREAVFFDDLPDLLEKLVYYWRHPQETEAIARAGHARYWQCHTNSARARQLLHRALGAHPTPENRP